MKVGVIGSGGREHALCLSLKKSNLVEKIYCFPGNAGTNQIAENINIDLDNFEEIKDFIIKNNLEFIIVGPEKPLVDGIVDYLRNFNIKIFGPDKIASQLEGSKIFTKKICEKYKIPTAKFGIYTNVNESLRFIENVNFPIVIKADGLAAGKGVYIPENKNQAENAIKEIFDGKHGDAKNLLIEEFLEGEEMSFFIISDGNSFQSFGTAQDHKRVLEGDKGKNTGGMGAYSPSRLENEKLNKKIIDKIIKPTLKALKDHNTSYLGFLYAGLMIINDEPFLIEYNVRMGDPECQTLLPKLKTDFFKIVNACLNKELDKIKIEWSDEKSLCIVLCAKGYPDKYEKDKKINLNNLKLNSNQFLFHAGTQIKNNQIMSNGGRVLNIVSKSNNFLLARNNSLEVIRKIDWDEGFYRRDIGHKVIDE